MPATPVIWFRRDLRLDDNAAVHAALGARACVPLFVLPGPEVGAASKAWLARSLEALAAALQEHGSDLVVLDGPPQRAFLQLSGQIGPLEVHVTSSSDPLVALQSAVAAAHLAAAGTPLQEHGDPWLVPPATLQTKGGTPYKVFTPFWRAARAKLVLPARVPSPVRLPALPAGVANLSVPPAARGLAPALGWDAGFWASFTPGEAGAKEALEVFCEGALQGYSKSRERPDQVGSSRLSAHLTWGEISVHECARTMLQEGAARAVVGADAERFITELGWREFARHLFVAYPQLATQDFSPSGMKWAAPAPAHVRAWQQGETGLPMVDAAMRELWQTGWMHNRSRMVVADFWCKHLGYDWRAGAAWFWDTLVDADLANNTIGWQWAAGTGPDAAPYYRIFNPILQGQKFDPAGRYRHRYLPELAHLSGKALDEPPSAPGYPAPIQHPSAGRARALAAWGNRQR